MRSCVVLSCIEIENRHAWEMLGVLLLHTSKAKVVCRDL